MPDTIASTSRTITTRDGVEVPNVTDLPESVKVDRAIDCGLTHHVRLIGDPRRPVLIQPDLDGRPVPLPAGSVIRCSEPTAASLAQSWEGAPCRPDGRILNEMEQQHIGRHLRCRPTSTWVGRPFEPASPFTPSGGDVVDYIGYAEDTIRAVRLTRDMLLRGDVLAAGTVIAVTANVAVTLIARSDAQRADGRDQGDVDREAAAALRVSVAPEVDHTRHGR